MTSTLTRSLVHTRVLPMRWEGDALTGVLHMLDQRQLPHQERWFTYDSAEQVAQAIRDMVTRGAPAIGIAAAFGVVLGLRQSLAQGQALAKAWPPLRQRLAQTRPTAVNLFWALERMEQGLTRGLDQEPQAQLDALLKLAQSIMDEDGDNNLRMGQAGAALLAPGARVLTHCNTGGLATGGYGTALGVLRAAFALGKLEHIWIDETRPYLQGARLTAWECVQDGLPATLITDNMAAHLMARGLVDAVIVGADRIAANGDTANKIGTYGLAVLCAYHKLPFYVAAPVSTLDLSMADGSTIPIEERSADEVTHVRGQAIAPPQIAVAHPAFDVTPGHLVTAIITERGVVRSPYPEGLRALVAAM